MRSPWLLAVAPRTRRVRPRDAPPQMAPSFPLSEPELPDPDPNSIRGSKSELATPVCVNMRADMSHQRTHARTCAFVRGFMAHGRRAASCTLREMMCRPMAAGRRGMRSFLHCGRSHGKAVGFISFG